MQPLQKRKIPKEKSTENCLAEIRTLESIADTQKCGRKQNCRNLFRQSAPCLFSSAIPKVGIGYADSEVYEARA
ncbi:hypothetical protein HMPREF0658_0297 [Hoylesella marshii DSM 16973 = JCM 13450]|uniref:Uncharacterized protein n=1 Tax=Hoylesella marshii DSM 16973 = JCM 13450 TaxID=862515 RepID=E0NQ46_9BACT|nr:hypothetical protein HMPREF0658_0297 [Hoylesella marshii DSM 16973 = JCM 13450]